MMTQKSLSINVGGRLMTFETPKVMAILNVTPDSFYAGSRNFDSDRIGAHVGKIIAEGADIIDIGGYSTRPGAPEVTAEEEYNRLARGLEIIRRKDPDAVVSVDTFRADVARRCVEEWNVQIINDISGGDMDPEMGATVADLRVAYILMHTRGTPQNMQQLTDYRDVTAEVIEHLARRIYSLRELGVCDIIADPGFGFAKTLEQNYTILREFNQFKRLGVPVLTALSRKSMIYKALHTSPDEALAGTVALDTVALLNGADLIRVHDVRPAVETIKLLSLLNASKC